jgi:phosphoglycolate phosphatase
MSQPETRWERPRPDAVVWDLDGTLVESAPDLAKALNAVLNEHDCHGHPVAQVRPMIGDGVAKLIERGFRAAGAPLDEADCQALVPRFMEIYMSCATDSTHLVPGARDAVLSFYNAGIKQAICTNKPLAVTLQILDALDVRGYFGAVVGGDSTAEKKPHPLPLQHCLEQLRASPGRAVVVGDSAADVGAARACGIPVVLVPDGYTGVPAESLGADYVVRGLADVPGLLLSNAPLRQSA